MCRLTLSCCCYHVSRVIVTEQMSGLLLGFPGILIPGCRAGSSHRCRRGLGKHRLVASILSYLSLLFLPPVGLPSSPPAVWMASLAVAAVPPATLPSHAPGRHDCRSQTFPAEAGAGSVCRPVQLRRPQLRPGPGTWSLFASPTRAP